MATSDSTTVLKICTKCNQALPSTNEYFARASREQDGLRRECKRCQAECNRQWRIANADKKRASDARYREENREQIRAGVRRWLAENQDLMRDIRRRWVVANPDMIRASAKRRYEANPDFYRNKTRQYRENNREATRESVSRYRASNPARYRAMVRARHAANPEISRAADARRRARKLGAGGTYGAADIRLQVKAQTGRTGLLRCWWCSKVISNNEFHVDHRIPLAKGGSNAPDNICISCPKCNLSKSSKLPSEFNGRLI